MVRAVVKRVKPVTTPQREVPKTEELTCTNCESVWSRPKQRGRKTKLCPTCAGTTTTTAIRKEATEAEVNERLDNLDRNLKANGSHLSQQPEVRVSYSLHDMNARLTALESLCDDLDERLSKLEE